MTHPASGANSTASKYHCHAGTYHRGASYGWVKRLLDVSLSFVLLLLGLPFLIVIGLIVALTSPGGAIYRSRRVGLDGKEFTVHKFRTMVNNAHHNYDELRQENGDFRTGPFYKNPYDPRTTPVGKFLRSWSIDELPQLWDVFRGRMSLVGPRPSLPVEVAEMGEHGKLRLTVKPGMTGICQINGRVSLPYEDFKMLEEFYIDNRSHTLDFCIIKETFGAVWRKHGAF